MLRATSQSHTPLSVKKRSGSLKSVANTLTHSYKHGPVDYGKSISSLHSKHTYSLRVLTWMSRKGFFNKAVSHYWFL